MIVEVPVLYRAAALPARKRTIQDVLMRTWIPVSIPQGDPEIAIEVREVPGRADPATVWYERDGVLLGDALRIREDLVRSGRSQHGYPKDASSPDRRLEAVPPAVREVVRDTATIERFSESHSYPDPFVSHEAVRMGRVEDGSFYASWESFPRVLEEDADYRGTRMIRPDVRDVAIAHARAAARGMMVHAGTGRLLVPTTGPLLAASADGLVLQAEIAPGNGHVHLYSLDAADQAVETARQIRIEGGQDPIRPELMAYRGDLVRPVPEAVGLATAAAILCGKDSLPFREGYAALGVLHGYGSLASLGMASFAILLSRMAPDLGVVDSWGFDPFEDRRDPSPELLAASAEIVREGVSQMRAAPASEAGPAFRPEILDALEGLLHRAAHLLPGETLAASRGP